MYEIIRWDFDVQKKDRRISKQPKQTKSHGRAHACDMKQWQIVATVAIILTFANVLIFAINICSSSPLEYTFNNYKLE